jgi:hypothetical protein
LLFEAAGGVGSIAGDVDEEEEEEVYRLETARWRKDGVEDG